MRVVHAWIVVVGVSLYCNGSYCRAENWDGGWSRPYLIWRERERDGGVVCEVILFQFVNAVWGK